MKNNIYKRLCRQTQKPVKYFTVKFLIVLIMAAAACVCSAVFLGFNPVFNAACGCAVGGIFMLIFGMVKD